MRRNATACPKPERSEDHLDRPESNSVRIGRARNRMTRAEDFESFARPKMIISYQGRICYRRIELTTLQCDFRRD